MNKTLKNKILSFLDEASSYIQIIFLKSDPLNSVQAFEPTVQDTQMEVSQNDEVEPMDISDNQIETMN